MHRASAISTSGSMPTASRGHLSGRSVRRFRRTNLNLGYTEVRAPVTGRVGKLEVTVGNLVAAGPGAPVLTTLVSVSPIYASFNADEQVVARALKSLARSTGAERMLCAFRCG